MRVPSESSDSDPPGRISPKVYCSYQNCTVQSAALVARATDTPSDPDPSQRDVPRPPDPEHSNVPRPPDSPYRAADASEIQELAIPAATVRSEPEAVDTDEPPMSLLRDGVNAWIGPPQTARREKRRAARSDFFTQTFEANVLASFSFWESLCNRRECGLSSIRGRQETLCPKNCIVL